MAVPVVDDAVAGHGAQDRAGPAGGGHRQAGPVQRVPEGTHVRPVSRPLVGGPERAELLRVDGVGERVRLHTSDGPAAGAEGDPAGGPAGGRGLARPVGQGGDGGRGRQPPESGCGGGGHVLPAQIGHADHHDRRGRRGGGGGSGRRPAEQPGEEQDQERRPMSHRRSSPRPAGRRTGPEHQTVLRPHRSRGKKTRTSGLVVPNDARYQAAPHPEVLQESSAPFRTAPLQGPAASLRAVGGRGAPSR